jgi:single-stranded-DNA-specific exonuclease
MAKQWTIKQFDPGLEPVLPEYPALILKLLALRGITQAEAIKDFLAPDYANLHDPFLFQDMQKAVERLDRAIRDGELITIFADYDADAITACSVAYLALQKLGARVDYYIPDRFAEGYGMNAEAVRKLGSSGTRVIVTVDCGTNSVAEAQTARELGMDLIITDHHELTGELPQALAVINPKNPADNYPFPYLTGVGVAYKLVQALFSREEETGKREISPGWEKWLLDLVAIGTVADLQSLTGENRILVSFGLKVLQKTRRAGLQALLELAGARKPYDAFTLGFILAPRINAAGRLAHASAAFELLVASDPAKARQLAVELDELNKRRQFLTEQILSEARAQVEMIMDRKILLVAGRDWPKGVVGLVAVKLSEEYNRPVLVMDRGEEFATGSARSVEAFDIVAALAFAKEHLVKYGGHKQAAGYTLESAKIENLYDSLLRYAEETNYEISEPVLVADAELFESDLTFDNLELVEKLAPFGFGNPKPKFISRGLELIDATTVGSTGKHAKMRVRLGNAVFSAIAFNQGYLAAKIQPGQKFDAFYELTGNEWNGVKRIDLKIIDVQVKEN